MTPKAILKALRRDYEFYAPRCLRILEKDGKLSSFHFNEAQRYIHARLSAQLEATGKVRAIILKGRQQGCSTYITGRFYHRTSMSFGVRTFILTHETAATSNLYGMVRRYHEHMQEAVKPVTGEDSAKSLYFSGLDSRFSIATAGAKATGRSATAQLFHGSEVAFWPNAETHMAGIGQIIPDLPGTEIVLESTANGIGNLFHSMWQDAIAGRSAYEAIFIPWYWEPGYAKAAPEGFTLDAEEADYMDLYGLTVEQMVWRRDKIAELNGDENLFNQEYPATAEMAFNVAATDALIKPQLVQAARSTGPIQGYGPLYMGVDPAEYGDDATAIIFRRGREAFGLRRYHKKGPMEIAGIVAELIDEHKPSAVCIDATGSGIGVCDALQEQDYDIYAIKFGARALDERYKDRRTEIWVGMLHWFQDDPVTIPQDEVLGADLTGLSYSYNSARQMVLESKEHARGRGIQSPDTADALACTFGVRISEANNPQGGPKWKDRLRTRSRKRSAQAA